MSLVSWTGVFLVSEQRITLKQRLVKTVVTPHPYFVEDWYFEGLEKAIYAEFFSPNPRQKEDLRVRLIQIKEGKSPCFLSYTTSYLSL